MHIAILNDVAMELEKDLDNTKNKVPLYAAIDNYHGRIEILFLVKKTKRFRRTWEALKLLSSQCWKRWLGTSLWRRKDWRSCLSCLPTLLENMEKNIKRNFASRLTYYFLVLHTHSSFSTSWIAHIWEKHSVHGKTRKNSDFLPLIMTRLQNST